MAISKPKRKTRSDKFPLTLHKTGQFCKKIKGKIYYFGTNKKAALERYLEQATDLHAGRNPILDPTATNITIFALGNLYLEHQEAKVQVKELTARHYDDQINSLRMFVRFLGRHCQLDEISTIDLQNYKKKLQKAYGSAHRINLNIAIMKAMFHWAKKNDVIASIPNIDAISKVKVIQKERATFTVTQIDKLLAKTDGQMKAMIWLGLNCGFGCTDCAELKWKNLNLKNARVNFARGKTGVGRNLPLWSETMEALREIPKVGELVFYTSKGNPWVRTIESVGKNGRTRYTNDNAVSKQFSKLLKKANVKTEKGVGFYTLRRTAATLAARSGDPFAVQRLLGHADLKMATTYVQNVSEQTDRVINNSRKLIIQDNS